MDQPQKSLLTALTILATVAAIFGCIFAAPPFILSLRELWGSISPSAPTTQPVVTPTPVAPRASPSATATKPPTPSPSPTASNVWKQGTLRVEASLLSVTSSNIRLQFKIVNQADSDFVARFRMEDFTLADDAGRSYMMDSSGLQTATIRANGFSLYSLGFRGVLSSNAKTLTLHLAQLSNLPDIAVAIAVGGDVSSVKSTAGIVSTSSSSVRLSFKLTNEGSNEFIARFRMEDFSLIDDTGKSYPSDNSTGYQVAQINANASSTYSLTFRGPLNPSAKKLILQLAQLSGSGNISVEIPINPQ